MIDVVARSIGNCAGSPQAAPAGCDGGQQAIFTLHVQKCVVLAGKGHVRKIFGSSRGAHGHRWTSQRGVRSTERGGQAGRYRAFSDAGAQTFGMRSERVRIVRVDRGYFFVNPAGQSCAVYKVRICGDRYDEAVRDTKSQVYQLGQVFRFATDPGQRWGRRIQWQAVAAVNIRGMLKTLVHPACVHLQTRRLIPDLTTSPFHHQTLQPLGTVLTTPVDFGMLGGYLIAPFFP